MKKKIIFVSGVASSGKSTLCNALRRELGADLVEEQTQRVTKEHLIKASNDPIFAGLLQSSILSKYDSEIFDLLLLSDKEYIVVDRALIDVYNYAELYGVGDIALNRMQDLINKIMIQIADYADIYIFTTQAKPFKEDGKRYSKDFQREIDIFQENQDLIKSPLMALNGDLDENIQKITENVKL